MKKMIFAAMAACCLMAGTTISAQQRPTRDRQPMTAEQLAKQQTERMTERLKLDDVQKQEVYKLNLAQAEKMQQQREERRNADAQTREADREQMKQQAEAYDAQLKKLLSAEQYKQWSEQKQARGGNWNGHRPKGAVRTSNSDSNDASCNDSNSSSCSESKKK